MLEGLPIVGWLLGKFKRRPRQPQTHLNIIVYGDVINSNINVNAPSESELRLGRPAENGEDGEGSHGDQLADG